MASEKYQASRRPTFSPRFLLISDFQSFRILGIICLDFELFSVFQGVGHEVCFKGKDRLYSSVILRLQVIAKGNIQIGSICIQQAHLLFPLASPID